MPKVVNLAEWKALRARQGFESPTITDICARLEAALDNPPPPGKSAAQVLYEEQRTLNELMRPGYDRDLNFGLGPEPRGGLAFPPTKEPDQGA